MTEIVKEQKQPVKKEEMPNLEMAHVNIVAFSPPELNVFKTLFTLDTLYRGVRKDEEQQRLQLINLKKAIGEIRKKPNLSRQIALGIFLL